MGPGFHYGRTQAIILMSSVLISTLASEDKMEKSFLGLVEGKALSILWWVANIGGKAENTTWQGSSLCRSNNDEEKETFDGIVVTRLNLMS